MSYITEGEEIFFSEYEEADFENYFICYNKFYQGGYPRVEYFEKNSLREKLATGNLLLTLGKLADGTVVSVSAAERKTGVLDGIVELFMRCVAPAYQGRHVGTEHEKYLFERISVRFPDATSLQADAVTFDVKSQTTLKKNGFSLCGFCLMMYDSKRVLPALSCRPGTRMSFAVYCKPLRKPDVTVYPPPEHSEMIFKLYERLHIQVHSADGVCSQPTETEYEIARCDEHKTAELTIKVPGNDGAPKMLAELKEMFANGYTVTGQVNMSRPGCVPMYRLLQKAGFYFSGVRPLSNDGQYLLVAQTANSSCGYDTVFVLESEEFLLDYVKLKSEEST